VAFWDFAEPGSPYRSSAGNDLTLRDGGEGAVRSVDDGPFGRAAVFDGASDYLQIPIEEIGPLDLTTAGGCTVVAWVFRATPALGFVAGRWNEDDAAPSRQYGLFLDLPGDHGGTSRVIGHVSRTGEATPGYPFAMELSASRRGIAPGGWRCAAFSYDGANIRSFLDGLAEPRPFFVEPLGRVVSKNPYPFPDGMNPHSVSDFTVGGNRVGTKLGPHGHRDGMGCFFAGRIGGLAVFDRALSARELLDIHLAASDPGDLVADLTPYRGGGWSLEPSGGYGWASALGLGAVDTTHVPDAANFLAATEVSRARGYLLRTAIERPRNRDEPAFCFADGLDPLTTSDVGAVEAAVVGGVIRLALRVDGAWHVSSRLAGPGLVRVPIVSGARGWRSLDYVEGRRLTVDESVDVALPEGQLEAVGIYSPGLGSADAVVRITDVALRR
jgi:hypothetical protein